MRRAQSLITGKNYHIYTKSIYGFIIYPTHREYERMLGLVRYYCLRHDGPPFSHFINTLYCRTHGFNAAWSRLNPRGCGGPLVRIRAFCLMPTHVHFILEQSSDDGIRDFMSRILNGYTRFFNQLHNRKGPLWQERFGASLIRDEEQLQTKIDYVHNNPVKDLGLSRPEDWAYSSFRETHGLPTSIPSIINLHNPGG